MKNQSRNLYQIARNSAGMTQEKASELLCVSVESLRAYETGRTVPPNDIVSAMIGVYNTQYLAYQHIMHSSEVARQCLPLIELKDLPEAILRLQKEVTDFVRCRDELIDITCDGIITDKERPRYNAILKELDDIVGAIMALKFAKTKKER